VTTRPYDLTITPSGQSNGISAIASVKPPESPYLITAGSVIPAVLIGGINSELPGPILAQVRENVFDSASGRWVLIPQGAKVVGSNPTGGSNEIKGFFGLTIPIPLRLCPILCPPP